MRSKSFIISAISSLLIIAMLFFTNWNTYWGHPWFIYPTFVVLWWPLSIYFAENHNYTMYSVSASVLTTVFFVLVNLITKTAYPWFIFPVFAIWWWPLVMLTARRKRYRLFSVIGSLYTAAFFLVVNIVTTPETVWFIYPVFAVLWWPLSQLLCGMKKYKLFSVIASLYTIGFFALVNFLTSPATLWFVYPAFGIAWWPLSMFFAKRYPKIYSVVMSAATIGFLAVVNLAITPEYMWFYQAIFFILWWPVVMLLGNRAKSFTFAVISAAVIIAYFYILHNMQTPELHPWYLYTIFPAVWWPVCVGFKKHITKIPFLLASLAFMMLYYGALNFLLTPHDFWMVYLLYPALWVVMGVFFGSRRMYLGLSVYASITTILFFAIVNYTTSPGTIWAVYPAFAIVWWPLSIFFYKYKNKKYKHSLNEAAR